MKVTLIAATELTHANFPDYVVEDWLPIDLEATEIDNLHEFAGRACYQSFHRPNPETAANVDYLGKNILGKGHYSVLGHSSLTFYAEDVSRALTHELIRSRFLVFSELSQRYVDMSESYTVVPPLFREDPETIADIQGHHENSVALYDELVRRGEAKGASRKAAREAARCVLPGGTETKIVVTGYLRAWRDFIEQRWSKHADAEIQEFAGEILTNLREYAPNSVQDIPEQPYE